MLDKTTYEINLFSKDKILLENVIMDTKFNNGSKKDIAVNSSCILRDIDDNDGNDSYRSRLFITDKREQKKSLLALYGFNRERYGKYLAETVNKYDKVIDIAKDFQTHINFTVDIVVTGYDTSPIPVLEKIYSDANSYIIGHPLFKSNDILIILDRKNQCVSMSFTKVSAGYPIFYL